MQVRDLAAGCPIGLIACGFSPPAALAALAEHLRWPGLFLADEQRRLYALLGMRRATLWRVYSPRTLAHYVLAAARGRRLPRPVEDTRQMGGDALVRAGIVVRRWLPRTPDDRVRPARLLHATGCSPVGRPSSTANAPQRRS
ncbi:MAG TPA: AhpC/TSA family protein [Pseudonocardiaceae bacterium]|nr:AhpC/TSA family protein [Pseudonocardiaceae bacterium]